MGANTSTYLYDYIDRMTKAGAGPMQWDEWGSMTSYYAHTCEWDDSDRMTKFDRVGSTEYDADYHYLPGSWKRYKRTLDGATEYFVYGGDNVLASYASV